MNDLRTAAQQALAALEQDNPSGRTATITALHAAPPQQAEPVAVAERERIAAQWDGCVTHRLDTFGPVDIGASIRAGELVGPAQQAEPVEPVAIVRWNDIGHISWRTQVMLPDNTPLYTAQPRHPDTDCHTQGICQRSGYGITQQAEPVEPVAWIHTDAYNPKVRFLEWTQQAKGYRGDWIKTPLYTAQPRQTDPQIEDRLARHGIPKP